MQRYFLFLYVHYIVNIALAKDLWGDVVVHRFRDCYDTMFRLHSVNKVSYFSAFKLDATWRSLVVQILLNPGIKLNLNGLISKKDHQGSQLKENSREKASFS